ncbi:MAG: hypothetical protein WC788_07005 [Candidatus Paceibacterota bacterium]
MENETEEIDMEPVAKELEKGMKVIVKQKKKARSTRIDTHRITGDEDLEDILSLISEDPKGEVIELDDLKADIKSRIKEIHAALKADVAALRSMRAVLRMI